MSRIASALVLFPALAGLLWSCEKKPVKPKRTEPWPAVASASRAAAPERSAPVRYLIAASSKLTFELPAREARPRGMARLVRGEITVYLDELSRSTGTVEVDLGSIRMETEDAGPADSANSERALSWLDIGSSRPEAERERLRWAKYELGSLEDLFSSTADRAKRVPFTAVGELSLHGFRVQSRAALELEFVDTDAGTPAEIVIRTRRPLVVSLATHDIKPRDSHGVLLAQETKLLGVRVGREALVSLELRAKKR